MPIVTALIGTPARPRLRPGALDPHARTALGRAAALLGGAAPPPTLAGARPEELEATLLETLDLVAVRASSGDAEAAGVLTDLHHALAGVRAQRAASAADGLVRVQEALSHLRGVDSLPAVVAKGAQVLCRSCGFDRAIVFRLEGSHLVAEAVHFEGDDEGAREVLAYSRRHPAQLTHAMLETQMIRRRAPGLVLDARSDPRTHRDMVDATHTRSYVAAPIMPAGQVIGFVHADRFTSGRQVDAADRDLLWAFAEGFGYAVERTALGERLREQRDQVRQMSSSTEA